MEKSLALLHHRLKKIDERKFDLNSWKKGTIAVLDSILGEGNLKRKQIEEIEFENNSWSLRDTTGDVESIKKACADVLETIILEIETFGLAEPIEKLDKKEKTSSTSKPIEKAIRKELSQSQLDELMTLVKQKDVDFNEVVDKFKRFGYEVAPRILANIILNKEVKKSLGK
ncbi:hypothetical protein [Labilibacter marinus]|uniref:hypothetical protein n=1 Tax=Labilibacter marinus TaxID=1477105 RepID=UPI00082DF2C5|nr:hypothetical protein [Labilibacter marinus]